MTGKPLALKLAWRYLTAPKSHGAVSAIAIVSVVGVAVATAAIIIVLSVFNGFRTHLDIRMDSVSSDVEITPAQGKVILESDSMAEVLSSFPGVEIAMPAITDNALAIANSKEMPITLKGVNLELFPRLTVIDSLLLDGIHVSEFNENDASISVGVAQRLGIYSAEGNILVFTPRRIGRINVANPASSFLSDSLEVKSIFRSLQNEVDENTIICDIETARDLYQYDNEATSIEIKADNTVSPTVLAEKLSQYLGEEYVVKDRFQQHEVNARMVAVEKWITFLLLTFILLIASFNIISTLSMLIVEKENSLKTLSDIGLSKSRIGRIFVWESLFVTLFGAISGIVLGVILCLLQENFSLIKLAGDPDSLVLQAYPVKLEWIDLAVTFAPVMLIGLITALISRSFAKSVVTQQK